MIITAYDMVSEVDNGVIRASDPARNDVEMDADAGVASSPLKLPPCLGIDTPPDDRGECIYQLN